MLPYFKLPSGPAYCVIRNMLPAAIAQDQPLLIFYQLLCLESLGAMAIHCLRPGAVERFFFGLVVGCAFLAAKTPYVVQWLVAVPACAFGLQRGRGCHARRTVLASAR
jgi:hypothetical protein